MITRRLFMTMTGFAAATVCIKTPVVASAITGEAPKPATTIWVGGHDGAFDWQPFAADTEEEALAELFNQWGVPEGGAPGSLMLQRAPLMDGKQPREIIGADWIRSGLGHICDRCSYETSREEGARIIAEEVVCEECLTLADRYVFEQPDDFEDMMIEKILDHDGDLEAARRDVEANGGDTIPDDVWTRARLAADEHLDPKRRLAPIADAAAQP